MDRLEGPLPPLRLSEARSGYQQVPPAPTPPMIRTGFRAATAVATLSDELEREATGAPTRDLRRTRRLEVIRPAIRGVAEGSGERQTPKQVVPTVVR